MEKKLKPKKIKSFFRFKTGPKHLQSTVSELSQLGFHIYSDIFEISGIIISSDKNFLVIWRNYSCSLVVWDITKQLVANKLQKALRINTVALTLNDSYLIISISSKELIVYDFKKFRESFRFRFDYNIFLIKTIKNNEFYAIDMNDNIILGSILEQKVKNIIPCPALDCGDIRAFDLNSSENFLALGRRNGQIQVLNLITTSEVFSHKYFGICVTCIKFHLTDAIIIVSYMDLTIKLFYFTQNTQEPYLTLNSKSYIWDFIITKDHIFCRSQSNIIEKWRIGEQYPEQLKSEKKIKNFSVSSDRSLLVYSITNCTIFGIDIETEEIQFKLGLHTGKIIKLLPWEKKKFIVTCSQDDTMRVWDYSTFKCLAIHQMIAKDFHSIAISSKGNYLVKCELDLTIIYRH